MSNSVRRFWAIVGIGLGITVVGMAWSIINTGLSSIQKELSASVLQLQWVMNSFGICLCVPLLTMGKLGDAYGRKGIYCAGIIGCGIASLGAGLATDIAWIIGWMALLGLCSSAILPLSQALLVHQFPENRKGTAIAIWSTFASLSLGIGPFLGGIIINYLNWRWIFFINIPILFIALPLLVIFVKKEVRLKGVHCDWGGVGLLAVIVFSLVMGIMQGPNWGWSSIPIIGLFCVTVIAFCFFLALERRTKTPLFRPELFSHPRFVRAAISNGCIVAFFWGVFFFIPLYMQNSQGDSALFSGTSLLFVTVPVVLFSVLVSKLVRKYSPKLLILPGFSLLILATLILALFSKDQTYWPIGLGCLLMGFGWVMSWGPSIAAGLSSVPHHLAGIASGMFTTMQEGCAIVSLAISGVVFRAAHTAVLLPHTEEINDAFSGVASDRMDVLLTNPIEAGHYLGEGSPIVPWLQKAFLEGFSDSMWFLFALAVIGGFFGLILPKFKQPANG